MSLSHVKLTGLLLLFLNYKYAQSRLFEFPHPIKYNSERNDQCEQGSWSFDGRLELAIDKLLKFFVPVVDVMVSSQKLCSIDLTSCPSSILPEAPDVCFCSGKVGDIYHLSVSCAARTEHSNLIVKVGLPLRYSWFRFSKVWEETVGNVPQVERAVDEGWSSWSFDPCDIETGIRNKTRVCNTAPRNGELQCEGNSTETEPCDVDGGFTEWSQWACDGQYQARSRECTQPRRRHGGKPCNTSESYEQGRVECPGYQQCNWGAEMKTITIPPARNLTLKVSRVVEECQEWCAADNDCERMTTQVAGNTEKAFCLIWTYNQTTGIDQGNRGDDKPENLLYVCRDRQVCQPDAWNANCNSWTEIQRRISDDVTFVRNWTDYQSGFGDRQNFWLGLDAINELCNLGQQCHLRVELSFEGFDYYFLYDTFYIANASDKYRLHLSRTGNNGTAGDSLNNHDINPILKNNGMQFSTVDNDNDRYPSGSCAVCCAGRSGWWYNLCYYGNLNGPYDSNFHWYTIGAEKRKFLSSSSMKVLPRD